MQARSTVHDEPQRGSGRAFMLRQRPEGENNLNRSRMEPKLSGVKGVAHE